MALFHAFPGDSSSVQLSSLMKEIRPLSKSPFLSNQIPSCTANLAWTSAQQPPGRVSRVASGTGESACGSEGGPCTASTSVTCPSPRFLVPASSSSCWPWPQLVVDLKPASLQACQPASLPAPSARWAGLPVPLCPCLPPLSLPAYYLLPTTTTTAAARPASRDSLLSSTNSNQPQHPSRQLPLSVHSLPFRCRALPSTLHSLLSLHLLFILSIQDQNIPSKMAELRRKLVIVGDGACGKTCLLM